MADPDAVYRDVIDLDAGSFSCMVSRPGKPHDAIPLEDVKGVRIDSAFIGSCTNGRIEDLREAAEVLKGRKVAPDVVLKIVPATDRIWNQCLEEGLIKVFKDAEALLSNPGCAGCAAGQVGQNGPGEVTISTGNRNFPGKQGQGEVYLASPAIAAASAVAGFITSPDLVPAGKIEDHLEEFEGPAENWAESVSMPSESAGVQSESPGMQPRSGKPRSGSSITSGEPVELPQKPLEFNGRAWHLQRDDIDTDMIYHNRHLAITDPVEMGAFALGNLEGYETFAGRARKGDVIFAGKNFGAGSSRQQAVDCFVSLGISCVIAESFGAIYERNAINAAFPILTTGDIPALELKEGDIVTINIETGEILNERNQKRIQARPFSDVQLKIYQNGGLF
jgi:3-isopropylmalate dehydratase small subunit